MAMEGGVTRVAAVWCMYLRLRTKAENEDLDLESRP